MTSPNPITLQSQPLPRESRRAKQLEETDEPAKKPKKVNSEIRKQQNRIASRNYREKRKKKLQYLQQLIKDGPDDQHESEPSPERYDSYERSVSAEYDSTKPGSSPYILRSTIESGAISSNCASGSEALLAASTATFNDHVYATTQAYTSLEPNWNAAVYPPPPPPNMTWNVHPWTPSVEYFPSGMPAPEAYNYSSEVVPQSFAPVHTPSQLPRQFLSSADFYDLGSPSYGPQSQSANRPNVSRPASSSYYPARHYQPY